MKGLEPSTFAMARRRSSQLSYIREVDLILAEGLEAVTPPSGWPAAPRRGRPERLLYRFANGCRTS